MAAKESNTKSFVLRIDADTMEAIEKWAADECKHPMKYITNQ